MTTSHRVLVTGGTGNTGRPLVARLRDKGVAARAASRHPAPAGADSVRLDWHDTATFEAALTDVSAAYLVPPSLDPEPVVAMQPFLEAAQRSGVTRVVLLGASVVESGGPAVGKVQALLPRYFDEWIVLRPSWFMQNFVANHHHAESARANGTILTATGEGRVAFIDAGDIAAVAAELLTASTVRSEELVLTGPEALSYSDVAELLTEALGREVRHVSVSVAELARHLGEVMPPAAAHLLASLDQLLAAGVEDRTTIHVEQLTGRRPRTLREVLHESCGN